MEKKPFVIFNYKKQTARGNEGGEEGALSPFKPQTTK